MRLPDAVVDRLLRRLARCEQRRPDVVIGGNGGGMDDAYLLRWHLLPRNRFFNLYYHLFLRSDHDRALHDHPWPNVSLILEGIYDEVLPTPGGTTVRVLRRQGDVVARAAAAAHRVELIARAPVRTLFVTGPKIRDWGFWCPDGWRPWTAYDGTPCEPGSGNGG